MSEGRKRVDSLSFLKKLVSISDQDLKNNPCRNYRTRYLGSDPCVNQNTLFIKVNLRKERIKQEKFFVFWLCKRFPLCFSFKNKKPLKIGISDDILIFYRAENFTPLNPKILHTMIHRYTNDEHYYRSMLQYKKRFDLFGNITESLSSNHIQYAESKLINCSR